MRQRVIQPHKIDRGAVLAARADQFCDNGATTCAF
jgi:hypothetical protein